MRCPLLLALVVVTACSARAESSSWSAQAASERPPPSPREKVEPPMTIEITSPAFKAEEPIPVRYTCEGDDVSPPLEWGTVPEGTKSLALILDDPDAPDPKAPKRIWVHWVLYDIPPDARGLAEAIAELPEGTRQGLNDWGRTGYGGPCPPVGRHRYFHRIYALDTKLPELSEPTRAALDAAMDGHILDRGELMGTYEKRPLQVDE